MPAAAAVADAPAVGLHARASSVAAPPMGAEPATSPDSSAAEDPASTTPTTSSSVSSTSSDDGAHASGATETSAESDTGSESDPGSESDAGAKSEETGPNNRAARRRAWWSVGPEEGPPKRRFLIGVEGLIAQAPPLRPTVIKLDPRSLGRTVAMGGIGIFGRYRPVPIVAIEATVRSASLRYSDPNEDTVVSQDHVLADVGVLLYLARGEVAQFAFDAGLGGAWGRIAYEPASGDEGSQTLGSGLVRVGADAEFLVKRVAFILSLRTVGIFTDPSRAKARGALFEGTNAAVRRVPVPALQTWLVGSAGVGYRF